MIVATCFGGRRGGKTAGVAAYHQGERTRCPACAASNWLVGRGSVECACCGMPLPLATPEPNPARFKTSLKG